MAYSPRKKKRVHLTQGPPFPIPIASITTEPARADRWFYYTGVYNGSGVTVNHSGDISFLYKMGFFGKGSLSRGMPEYNQLNKTVNLQHNDENDQFKVRSKRKYKRHLKWKKMCSGKVDDDDDDEDEDEFEEEKESEQFVGYDNTYLRNTNVPSQIPSALNKPLFLPGVAENLDDVTEIANHEYELSDTKSAEYLWEQSAADEDFWSTGNTNQNSSSSDKTVVHSSSVKSPSNSSQLKQNIPKVSDQMEDETKSLTSLCDMNEPTSESSISKSTNAFDNFSQIDPNVPERRQKNQDTRDRCEATASKSISILTDKRDSQALPSKMTTGNTANESISMQTNETDGQTVPSKVTTDNLSTSNIVNDFKEFRDVDSLCTNSDAEGDIFVIDDSDEDCKKRKKRKKWVPAIKLEPFLVKETLELSLEEAFFLSYGLGCLNVLTCANEPMSLSQMWKTFSQHKRFLPKYIAYHYYRSKGWVPKSGLKFGTDYIVYKDGPAFYHGSYSVVVKMVDSRTMTEPSDQLLSWRSLSGLNRITEHVAKNLLLCYVISPEMTRDEMSSPACIPKFKIQEIEISRWISTQEREENKTKELIP